MLKRYLKLALKGLWYVLLGLADYTKIFLKMLIMIPGIFLYVSLYEGEVVINMTAAEFILSPLFGIILCLSFLLSALIFLFRCAEADNHIADSVIRCTKLPHEEPK